MVFVGQETQFGKICKKSIIFVTPLLFMKKLCDPRFFMTPSIRKNMTAPLSLSHTKTLGVCGFLAL